MVILELQTFGAALPSDCGPIGDGCPGHCHDRLVWHASGSKQLKATDVYAVIRKNRDVWISRSFKYMDLDFDCSSKNQVILVENQLG